MNKIFDGKAILWTDPQSVESSALDQIKNTTQHPFLFKHVAIMPDVHCGYGATIGSVIPMDGVVIPNAVGVDIGCGMCAVQTDIPSSEISEPMFKDIHKKVSQRIPMGFKHREGRQLDDANKYTEDRMKANINEYERLFPSKRPIFGQVGTLGGGNHFIELQKDEDGKLWIMLHSGSRNIGLTIANHYIKEAKNLMQKYKISVSKDLDFLPVDTEEGESYIEDMGFALRFAKNSRFVMMEVMKDILSNVIADGTFYPTINIHHNYAALENHMGKNVWVHRKGATRVRDDITGIIPGSMGDSSFIVTGTNNVPSFNSCSHGAGRTMSRKKAKENISLDKFQEQMKDVYSKDVNQSHVDESPDSYKDIHRVMENQTDLVKIKHELWPVFNMKG